MQPLAILNPESRRGEAWLTTVTANLDDLHVDVQVPTSKSHFHSLLRQAVKEGREQIWVGGGDGTVRQAATELIHTPVVLGILPMGTGNALATELGIPANPAEMVNFLSKTARPRKIDVGLFNDEVFVNVATLGLTGQIAKALKSARKDIFGRLSYLPALIKASALTHAVYVNISSAEGHFDGRIFQFVAASTRLHGGPFPVTPHSSIRDGRLSVYVVRDGDRASLWRYGMALLRGHHTDLSNVLAVETRELTLELRREAKFVLDGDLVPARRATVQVLPGALNVLAAPSLDEVDNPHANSPRYAETHTAI